MRIPKWNNTPLEIFPDEHFMGGNYQKIITQKKALAKTVRAHYKKYPEALSMQASGAVIPDTVNNHS